MSFSFPLGSQSLCWRLKVFIIRVVVLLLFTRFPVSLVKLLDILSELLVVDQSSCAGGLSTAPAGPGGGDPLGGAGPARDGGAAWQTDSSLAHLQTQTTLDTLRDPGPSATVSHLQERHNHTMSVKCKAANTTWSVCYHLIPGPCFDPLMFQLLRFD